MGGTLDFLGSFQDFLNGNPGNGRRGVNVTKPHTPFGGSRNYWGWLDAYPHAGLDANGVLIRDSNPSIPDPPLLPRPDGFHGIWNPGPNTNFRQYRTGRAIGFASAGGGAKIELTDLTPLEASFDPRVYTKNELLFLKEDQVIDFKPIGVIRRRIAINRVRISLEVLFQ